MGSAIQKVKNSKPPTGAHVADCGLFFRRKCANDSAETMQWIRLELLITEVFSPHAGTDGDRRRRLEYSCIPNENQRGLRACPTRSLSVRGSPAGTTFGIRAGRSCDKRWLPSLPVVRDSPASVESGGKTRHCGTWHNIGILPEDHLPQ